MVQQRRLIDAIDDAATESDIDAACLEYLAAQREPLNAGRDAELRSALAIVTRAFLLKQSAHPDYRTWLDVFFGVTAGVFRSSLQQPNYLYYPSIPPVARFDTEAVPGLVALRESIAEVREEVIAAMDNAGVFEPYATENAQGDALWNALASNLSWSAIHLLKGGVWNEQMEALMPRAMKFLRMAPLAGFPPHAPECFVSRLSPGVELPPHTVSPTSS